MPEQTLQIQLVSEAEASEGVSGANGILFKRKKN